MAFNHERGDRKSTYMLNFGRKLVTLTIEMVQICVKNIHQINNIDSIYCSPHVPSLFFFRLISSELSIFYSAYINIDAGVLLSAVNCFRLFPLCPLSDLSHQSYFKMLKGDYCFFTSKDQTFISYCTLLKLIRVSSDSKSYKKIGFGVRKLVLKPSSVVL